MTGTEISGIIARLDAIRSDLVDIKQRVKETNGRVTQLEAREIAEAATLAERARLTGKLTGQAAVAVGRSDRNRDRLLAAAVTLAGVAAGAILTDVRFF